MMCRKNSFTSETIFEIPKLEEKITQSEAEINEPSFWENNHRSQEIFTALSRMRAKRNRYSDLVSLAEEVEVYLELVKESGEAADVMDEAQRHLAQWVEKVEKIEIAALLSGPYDTRNCIVRIQAGAGGTDAQDWAQMLTRMFVRWAERQGLHVDIVDQQDGDEAGIKSSTLIIKGEYAFGFLKNEIGVHRLVRISPFNANDKRQTSFAALDVIPELDAVDSNIQIDPKDLKIDTFRASGAGGQHVNKTDSAVRITHLPTGIVATSQNSRSQIDNRETAMGMLKARIVQRLHAEHKQKVEELRGEQTDIGWGHQIRSYVLHPYQMVKDTRTDVETSDVNGVLDGDIGQFIEAMLRKGNGKNN